MTYELIPPTEGFFSQHWFQKGEFAKTMMTDGLFSRIDLTRSKLNTLEVKLGQRLGSERYSPHLRSFLDRVNWLRGYIGIWTSGTVMPHGKWDAERIYPYSKHRISQWPDELFGERKEGNVLILLSPSVITWLNAVDRRLSGVSSWNVPYSVL